MKKIIFALLFLSGCASTMTKSFIGSDLLVQETNCCFQTMYDKMAIFDSRNASCESVADHMNEQSKQYDKEYEDSRHYLSIRKEEQQRCSYVMTYRCYTQSEWERKIEQQNYMQRRR